MIRSPLVEALLSPEAYPEKPDRVELVETHVSWLFLTGRYVYKVKKPVDFGFLDFTTLDKRRHFCNEEVRLNRRLSRDVYLNVVEIRREGNEFTVSGAGAVVEYAVKMLQLPRERAMRRLVEDGSITEGMVDRVAEKVWRFHDSATTSAEITRIGGLPNVRRNVEENFEQTERYLCQSISSADWHVIRAYSRAFTKIKERLFEKRAASGKIRDCHGDLHLAQIFIEDVIHIIDCIEFNERFRYSDVASDIAFLAMDLDFHGTPQLSERLIGKYVELSGDQGLREVLDFYKCYRAYVRGKVESFRLDEPGIAVETAREVKERATRYFRLARSYAQVIRGPAAIITTGLMGTGKSTLAAGLGSCLGAQVVSSDVLRKQMAGVPLTERRYTEWGENIYSAEFDARTYAELMGRGREALRDGRAVILDASYRKASHRQEVKRLAREMGARFWVMDCQSPDTVVKERLEARAAREGAVSDGRWELFHRQREEFQPVEEFSPEEHIVVDTSGSAEEVLCRALEVLYSRVLSN